MPPVKVCRCGASFYVHDGRFEEHDNPFTRARCDGSGKRPRKADGNGHGGSRKGAGRKPTAKAPRNVAVGPLLLTDAEARALRERAAQRNLSAQEAIRVALRCDGLID